MIKFHILEYLYRNKIIINIYYNYYNIKFHICEF